MRKTLLPEGWVAPRGYSNGILTQGGQTIYIGGQIGWNTQAEFETDDFVGQVRQTLQNVRDVLEAGGAGPEHMVRMTWYITDKQAYANNLRPIGQAYRDVMGKNFPVMSVVQVAALIEDRAQVEIEVTAVL
jgi:enamine deaminase RidA (YjgF/YER057c/UK114 family)|tara:strand:+ start:457 stop:849 length:393 start_codon:yes stop_codon:yes gene_type:complete